MCIVFQVTWLSIATAGVVGLSPLCLLLLLPHLFHKETYQWPLHIGLPLLSCLAAMWLSAALSPEKPVAAACAFGYTLVWLTGWSLARWLVKQPRTMNIFFLTLVSTGTIASVYASVTYFLFHAERAHLISVGPQGLGTVLVIICGVGLGYLQQQQSRWWLPFLAVMITGLILTFTRGAWLGFLITMLAYGIRYRKVLWASAGLLIAALLTMLLYPPLLNYAMIRLGSGASGRWGIWFTTWEIIKANPWFGVGVGVHPLVYKNYLLPGALPYASHAHNIILGMFADMGVVGGVLFMLLLGYISYAALRMIFTGDLLWSGVGAGLLGAIAHQMFDMTIYGLNTGILFWTLAALLCVQYRGRALLGDE
jgi:O-antigen ligase